MESSDEGLNWIGKRYLLIRLSLGGILLIAAALKAHQLSIEPTLETSLLTSRYFLVGIVEFEILLGLCLIAGVFYRAVWLISLACFALFACVSLYKALVGEATCGCFGSVQVNPWYTFALDSAAVFALIRWRPALARTMEPASERRPVSHYAPLVAVWLVVSLSAAWGMTRFEAATVSAKGDFIGDSEIVILEPETWVGKRFPLFDHIDIGSRLTKGGWVILLYHHDCSQCLEVLPEYEQLARKEPNKLVALVEVPPSVYNNDGGLIGPVLHGRLHNTKEWFVQTPTEIRLSNGDVTAVRGAESLARDRNKGELAHEISQSVSLDSEPVVAPGGKPTVSR